MQKNYFGFTDEMGILKSKDIQPRIPVRPLDELVSCTKFSREELQQMYRGFKNVDKVALGFIIV